MANNQHLGKPRGQFQVSAWLRAAQPLLQLGHVITVVSVLSQTQPRARAGAGQRLLPLLRAPRQQLRGQCRPVSARRAASLGWKSCCWWETSPSNTLQIESADLFSAGAALLGQNSVLELLKSKVVKRKDNVPHPEGHCSPPHWASPAVRKGEGM